MRFILTQKGRKERLLGCQSFILVCNEERPRSLKDGIEIMPWKYFLKNLWEGKLL